MGQDKLYRETKRKSYGFTVYTRMKTPICLTQNVTATIFRPRGLFFVCLVWVVFPMSIKGDFVVGLAQENVLMSWTTNVTDISEYRFIVNPYNTNIIGFPPKNVIGTAVPDYDSKVTEIGNVSLGTVSFRLLSLTVADAGRYYYKARVINYADGGQVLVIAGIPANITVMEVSDPIENERYTMQCSAQSTSVPLGMGLTMHYQWKWENGQIITMSDRYSFSSDQSNLVINPLQREDAINFVCEAWEHVGAVSQSAPFPLKVIYGPDPGNIQLSPNITYHDVTESSSLSVNCSTDCFPDCQYSWTGPDGLAKSDTRMLSIISMGRNQTGHYTCTASNSRIANKTTTSTINVVVFYGPDDSSVFLTPSNTSYQLVELSRLDVICSVTCFPQCNYQWSGPLVSQNDNASLSIPQISRNQTGTFTCTVTNPKIPGKSSTAKFAIIVYYGPDMPYLSPSTTVYTKQEGESVPDIICSAECFPGCTQVWTKGVAAVQESNGKTLSLRQVTREKAGDYTCWFNNTESRATGNISMKLIVKYPPVLTMKATNTSKGGRVVITCTANGVPDNYTFYKLTHMAPDESRTIVRELELKRVSNRSVSFTIEKATYQDTGFYVCKASNGITHYITGQLVMDDMVSVLITDKLIITSNAKDFDAEKGKTGHMHIEFYSGLFQPLVTWYIVNNGIMELLQNSSHFRIYLSAVTVELKYYQKTIQLPGYNASLEVYDVNDEQFASYRVEINNSFAESVFVTLQLKPRGPPETPSNLNVVPDSVTTHSLQLIWQAGFHGGAPQTFVIEYREAGQINWLNKSEPSGFVLYVTLNSTITDLKDGTTYEFRIYSENVFNRSQISSTINETTKTVTKDELENPNGSSVIIGTVVGSVVVLVISVAIVGFLFYKRRKTIKSPEDIDVLQDKKKLSDRHDRGLKDNPVYDSSGPLPDPSTKEGATGDKYATVLKLKKNDGQVEDSSKLYAHVDKTHRGKNKGKVKEKHGKAPREDIYENATLAGRDNHKRNVNANSGDLKTDENVYENPNEASKGSMSSYSKTDGLMYADLMLDSPTTKNGKLVIRDFDNRTEYADIAFGKRGEPLPDNNEEQM